MSDRRQDIRAPSAVPARLDHLRGIKDGWLDGCGLAPSPEGLDWLERCLDGLAQCYDSRFDFALPSPYLYPTAEGGVQAEYSFGPYEITLEIDLRRKFGQWQLLQTIGGWDDWEELDLAQPESWSLIANNIRKYQILKAMYP